jgi:hypothetical protein
MSKVERKSVLVAVDSTGGAVSSFNYNIFINFQSDEVIVKEVSYFDNNAGSNAIFIVSSSITDNNPLFSISEISELIDFQINFQLINQSMEHIHLIF